MDSRIPRASGPKAIDTGGGSKSERWLNIDRRPKALVVPHLKHIGPLFILFLR